MMERVTPLTAEHFAGAIIMPNLVPPVDNLARLQTYRDEINAAKGAHVFDPLMMLNFCALSSDTATTSSSTSSFFAS